MKATTIIATSIIGIATLAGHGIVAVSDRCRGLHESGLMAMRTVFVDDRREGGALVLTLVSVQSSDERAPEFVHQYTLDSKQKNSETVTKLKDGNADSLRSLMKTLGPEFYQDEVQRLFGDSKDTVAIPPADLEFYIRALAFKGGWEVFQVEDNTYRGDVSQERVLYFRKSPRS